MAQAEKKVERQVIETVTVTLKLSEDEARTLAAVLSRTAGSRKTSPREHAVSILDALRRAGMFPEFEFAPRMPSLTGPDTLAEGQVRFRDYPEGA
jgi:hypothetical protein